MIVVLGASGFVGRAFSDELRRRGHGFVPLSRQAMDYTRFDVLFDYLRKLRPEFVINAAGFTGTADEEDCEQQQQEALAANTFLPQTIARACLMTQTPWGHVSSGWVYAGAKVAENGRLRVQEDLESPEFRRLLADHPERVGGFTEGDEPNFSFRHAPCSFYSGTKALAEEALEGRGRIYVWRPGLPFNESPASRNFLWRLQHERRIHDAVNSFSHAEDFVTACLDLWERKAEFGTYHVANPGVITVRQVADMIQRILKPNRQFEFCEQPDRPDPLQPRSRRPSCILNVGKLLNSGIKMRPVEEALEDTLQRWKRSSKPVPAPRRRW
ncbi:MAG: sugar nucleotide-binding protein [Verrucomicrobiota bacterium]